MVGLVEAMVGWVPSCLAGYGWFPGSLVALQQKTIGMPGPLLHCEDTNLPTMVQDQAMDPILAREQHVQTQPNQK